MQNQVQIQLSSLLMWILSCSLDHYGILLMWDSSMPQVKPTFDEMKKQQLPYQ